MSNLAIHKWEVFERTDGSFATFPFIKLGNYESGCVPEGHCAGYARRVANEFYGRDFEPNSAWNFRYNYETVRLKGFRSLRERFANGDLEPGFLVGFKNKNSNLDGVQRDMKNKIAPYTHLAVFLGENVNNDLVFGQQVIDLIGMQTDREMAIEGSLKPREIIKNIPKTSLII